MITKSVSEIAAILSGLCPVFIVDDLAASLDFYCSRLGFIVAYRGDAENNFWAFVRRDHVMLMFKYIAPEVHPQPNHSRHEWAPWDAYINTGDPDLLYREFVGRGVPMHRELADTDNGLRAFEVIDNNGYVLCFGCPRAT